MVDYFRKSLGQIRLTVVMGAIFYSVFAFLDAAIAPDQARTLWAIRFGVILPISAGVFALTFAPAFRRVWQLVLSVWLSLGALGIVAMIGIVHGEARNAYYAGLIMVLIILYTWSRVRFIWATLTGWLIVLAYEIVAVGYLRIPSALIVSYNFFFIGSNILGMLACYSIERYARSEHVMTSLLNAEREKVRKINQELALANEELKEQALIDDLTKISNRRVLDRELSRGWRHMTREGRPMALILCDVDGFKSYNDTHGHQAGDECLARVAAAAAGAARRPGDVVARYGGDEFAVLLLETNLAGGAQVAERLCRAVHDLAIPHPQSPIAGHVTISAGVASVVPTQGRAHESLIRKADECLYRAKEQGRNRVVAADI